MVIKLLGGKKASIAYQLKNPTARILHGDPAVTQRLIDGSNFSQKYCGIVLSFEENITAETESAILDDFRHLLRGGLEEDALDVLAVGHADKIIPRPRPRAPITTLPPSKPISAPAGKSRFITTAATTIFFTPGNG